MHRYIPFLAKKDSNIGEKAVKQAANSERASLEWTDL